MKDLFSVLKPFSQMFEMVMRTRILKYHTKMHILSTKQYGLRIGLKIDNAINKITNEILNAMINVPLVSRIL